MITLYLAAGWGLVLGIKKGSPVCILLHENLELLFCLISKKFGFCCGNARLL